MNKKEKLQKVNKVANKVLDKTLTVLEVMAFIGGLAAFGTLVGDVLKRTVVK